MRKSLGTILLVLILGFIGFGIYYFSTHKINIPEIKLASALSEEINVDNYTNAIDDLQKDENFNVESYPVVENNYSIQVVQIAESKDGELFIYTYEPSEKTTASTINISTAINESLSYTNYQLIFLNKTGTLSKYLVNNFQVKEDALRYYDISSIFRPFNKDFGDDTVNGNNKSERAFPVGQLWTACTVDGVVTYNYTFEEVIPITQMYVGFVRYGDEVLNGLVGYNWYIPGTDCHFVAFSTDKQMDKVLEIQVEYYKQSFKSQKSLYTNNEEWGDSVKCEDTLNHKDNAEVNIDYTHGVKKTYKWDRIQTIEKFFETENTTQVYEQGLFQTTVDTQITEEGQKNLANKQWVIRFLETPSKNYSTIFGSTRYDIVEKTRVYDFMILRLKFETDGVTYNLGVVSDKQSETPDQEPDNDTTVTVELSDAFKTFLKWLPLIVIALVLIPFLPYLIQGVIWVVKSFFEAIWFILTLPFQIFKKKDKGGK